MSKENALFPEVKTAIDFDALWQQASDLLATLSGDIWTDRGDHDLGITLLQSATWNCFDLSYRASLSLNDLLTPSVGTPIFPSEFAPERVLTCTTVTAEDYRHAILDLHHRDYADIGQQAAKAQDFWFSDVSLYQEPEVERYSWWYDKDKRRYSFIQPTVDNASKKQLMTLRGNSWLSLIPTRATQSLSAQDRQKVEQNLRKFLDDNRNLGEQITRFNWLQPAVFSPQITLELAGTVTDFDQLVAKVYQTVEASVRSTPARYTTEQRRLFGDANETIFAGPLLKHGWQEQLPSQIASSGIMLDFSLLVERLLAIPGVESLTQIAVGTLPEQITVNTADSWLYTVSPGYYPLLWGEDPCTLLASANSPLTLYVKGGIQPQLQAAKIEEALQAMQPPLIDLSPTALLYGQPRDLTLYTPVGQRLPECYRLQQPSKLIDDATKHVHQFLLLVDQLIIDGIAELAELPYLLAFTQRSDNIRGTRWPYADSSPGQDIHQGYAAKIKAFLQQSVAIEYQHGGPNFLRELDFLQYLLGYFGAHCASMPLTLNYPDFLETQRAYLAHQPELGYQRTNIRVDKVSALQKRIAAQVGLGSVCFAENPDLSQLPFYLIEHRQLLPQKPDSTFDNEQTPSAFSVVGNLVQITQPNATGKMMRGQLVDFIASEGDSKLYVKQLVVVEVAGDQFTLNKDLHQQLARDIDRLQQAFNNGDLRWQNSTYWLQDMDYRLNYAVAAQQPGDARQRLLASNAQTPYPAMVSVGDSIAIERSQLENAVADNSTAVHQDAAFLLKATIKAIDPVKRTLLIQMDDDQTGKAFPADEESFRYKWHFTESNYATTDRFSFVVSAVFDRSLIENQQIIAEKLIPWLQATVMAEFPAHVSLINHWLDKASFDDFAQTYKTWQNSGSTLGDDAFAIMKILTLGHLPTDEIAIGLMRVATQAQREAALGKQGNEWHPEVIADQELFYVPRN